MPQVDVWVSRDLDSRFSDREAAAVAEWLASDEPFHAMRDHPGHEAALLGNELINVRSPKFWHK